MKTIVRVFSNKPCTMLLNSANAKTLKTNKVLIMNVEVGVCCQMEFISQQDETNIKRLSLDLTPESIHTTYVVSVDWNQDNILCYQDSSNKTHRHLKPSEDSHCIIYDAETFSLYHQIDAPYKYVEDFNANGVARVKFDISSPQRNVVSVYRYGVINRNCKLIIPIEFEEIAVLHDGRIIGHKRDLSIEPSCRIMYIFDSNGNELFKRENANFHHLSNSAIDSDGLICIRHHYAPNTNSYNIGYTNLNNDVIIEPKYEYLRRFDKELFVASFGYMHQGVIDINENVRISFSYENIIPVQSSNRGEYSYIVGSKKEKNLTVINSAEEQIVEGEFEDVAVRNNLVCLLRDNA